MDLTNPEQLSGNMTENVIEQDPLAVIVVDNRKKGKNKYSKSKREIQEFEIAASKANLRVAKAVYRGLQVWEKERNASAEKKRDGALRDALKNGSKSMRKFLKTAAPAPSDLLDALAELKSTKSLLKMF